MKIPVLALVIGLCALLPGTASAVTIFLTSGSSWAVPNDWNNSNNTIECIGGGGGGGRPSTGSTPGGGGGGAGAYSKVTNVSYTAGASRSFTVGSGGSGATSNNTAGGHGATTTIMADDNSTPVCVADGGDGGAAVTTKGSGGAASLGTGSVKYSGGNGGNGSSGGGGGGGAGGGSAGPSGDGKNGGDGAVAGNGGGGGGGSNGGSSSGGSNGSGLSGGNGGNGNGGTGGGSGGNPGGNATTGTGGGGGGANGNTSSAGGAGAQQDIWTQTSDSSIAGPGGGGGAGGGRATGGAGGAGGGGGGYGSGGGGGGRNGTATGNGGGGKQGIIIITYYLASPYSKTITINDSVTASGDVTVAYNLSKGSGTFLIDHPLDPKNKLLYHSFVESPDVLNVYSGTTSLDALGSASVKLPDYFDALNERPQYFVRPLDAPMPNLHVRETFKNAFIIAGGVPQGAVSWTVIGVRRDPYIRAFPVRVEVRKGPDALVGVGEYLFEEARPSCRSLFVCLLNDAWMFLKRLVASI